MNDHMELITKLVRGMEIWAADEDGVHYKAWDAYAEAKSLLGETMEIEKQ